MDGEKHPKIAALMNKERLDKFISENLIDKKPCSTAIGTASPFFFGTKAGLYGDALEDLLLNAGKYGDVCVITDERKGFFGHTAYTLVGDVYRYLENQK